MNIAVCGAGVAGVAVARGLVRNGHRVVLFDQFDKPQPVGSGLMLQPVGLQALRLLELCEPQTSAVVTRIVGFRSDRIRSRPNECPVLDVRYDEHNSARGVERGALFDLLLQEALRDGVRVETSRRVVALREGRVQCRDCPSHYVFDVAVDARGAMTSVVEQQPHLLLPFGALWATVPAEGFAESAALEQRYEGCSRMVGVLPVGGGRVAFFWSLLRSQHSQWCREPLDKWKQDVIQMWPRVEPLLRHIRSHEDLVFARYAHRTLPPVEKGDNRVVRIGDAFHCTSPQLGQGANFALLDALAFVEAFKHHPSNVDDAVAAYIKARQLHIRLYQMLSFTFTPFYQSNSQSLAVLRDFVAAPISQSSVFPRFLSQLVAGQLLDPISRIDKIGRKVKLQSATSVSEL